MSKKANYAFKNLDRFGKKNLEEYLKNYTAIYLVSAFNNWLKFFITTVLFFNLFDLYIENLVKILIFTFFLPLNNQIHCTNVKHIFFYSFTKFLIFIRPSIFGFLF